MWGDCGKAEDASVACSRPSPPAQVVEAGR